MQHGTPEDTATDTPTEGQIWAQSWPAAPLTRKSNMRQAGENNEGKQRCTTAERRDASRQRPTCRTQERRERTWSPRLRTASSAARAMLEQGAPEEAEGGPLISPNRNAQTQSALDAGSITRSPTNVHKLQCGNKKNTFQWDAPSDVTIHAPTLLTPSSPHWQRLDVKLYFKGRRGTPLVAPRPAKIPRGAMPKTRRPWELQRQRPAILTK